MSYLGLMRVPIILLVVSLCIAGQAPQRVDPEEYKQFAARCVVYSLPGMSEVKVRRDIVYKRAGDEELKMDVYTPPSATPGAKLHAVVLIHGGYLPPNLLTPIKDAGQYTSYGRLLAAAGFAAITFNHRFYSNWESLQARHASLTSMRRPVVEDPEDPAGVSIRCLSHDFSYQSVKGYNPGGGLAMTKKLEAMHVEGGQISPSPAAFIFVFHFHGRSGSGTQGGMEARMGLDAGLLIGRNDELVVSQGLPIPQFFIEIQDTSGFLGELRITGKDPTAVSPRPNGLGMEPAPHRGVTDGGHQAGTTGLAGHLGDAPTRQREAVGGRQLAGQGFNVHDQLWGEKPDHSFYHVTCSYAVLRAFK
jgi:hypothetical protein